jgi:hypothetical protein
MFAVATVYSFGGLFFFLSGLFIEKRYFFESGHKGAYAAAGNHSDISPRRGEA